MIFINVPVDYPGLRVNGLEVGTLSREAAGTAPSLFVRERSKLTALLLIVSLLAFGPGLLLPLSHVDRFIWFRDSKSVVEILALFLDQENYLLFSILFGFGIVLPLLKLSLMWTAYFAGNGARAWRAVRLFDRIGKWSMLDVFIVAVFIVAVCGSVFTEMRLGPGAYFFTAAVITSMLASGRIRRLASRAA